MKLSLLIPFTSSRIGMTAELVHSLQAQIGGRAVEILLDADEKDSIGVKRNRLLQKAKGDYVAFIDSDDVVSKNYINHLFDGINKDVDCCSLTGVLTWVDMPTEPEIFEHSIKYKEWKTNNTGYPRYERYINHLNCTRASIAKQFKFPDQSHGEDMDWSQQIQRSGLIKTEHFIPETIYHYNYIANK